MTLTTKAIMNWSGGKDSSLCLHKILQARQYHKITLLTTVNEIFQRISMHGVRIVLLEQQAKAIGLPLVQLSLPESVSMEEYSINIRNKLIQFHREGFTDSIFGDIFLEDLRNYRESELQQVGMRGIFPLWKQSSSYLMDEFIDLGFKAILVCVNEKYMDQSFAGRLIDKDLVKDLPKNIDICGENGEYHSFVFDGPIFSKPVSFKVGEVVRRTYVPVTTQEQESDNCYSTRTDTWDTGFFYCDLLPV